MEFLKVIYQDVLIGETKMELIMNQKSRNKEIVDHAMLLYINYSKVAVLSAFEARIRIKSNN